MKRILLFFAAAVMVVCGLSAYTSYNMEELYGGRFSLAGVYDIHQEKLEGVAAAEDYNLYGLQFGWSPKYHWGGFDGELCGTLVFGREDIMDSTIMADLLLGYAVPLGNRLVIELDGAVSIGNTRFYQGSDIRNHKYTLFAGGGAIRFSYVLESGNAFYLKTQYTVPLMVKAQDVIKYLDDEGASRDLAFSDYSDLALALGFSFYL
ncbi:MAG: hypothetical protein JXA95_04660 [Spirochaetales bacterium]|nr:hypothetical protein [Spirochaetales bacterium]